MDERSRQVFISYHRADLAVAEQVRAHLVANGVKTWMDHYDISAGAYWPDEIDRGLNQSQLVELLVAQEKEVSELARDLIADLSLRHARTPTDGPALVAACVEGERHELGLRMICGLCRAEGYAVHYLGADVAPRFLLEAVQLHRPAVILLSAKLAQSLPAVKDAIDVLTAGLSPEPLPPIVVGGQIAIEQPEALRSWGAIPVTSAHPAVAVTAVTAILQPSPATIASTG